ncbi:MAG: LemA family protein [Pyrinomonadaceae bacterium]|jgi:LemA protein|nr:LemA family protein [Pyrinomonadaceae bacterium]
MKKIFLLTIVLLAVFSFSGCNYNSLTAGQQDVKGKWANVESALQRRADLIPNLVEAAKMAGIQEQEVFGQIADARSKLLGAGNTIPTAETSEDRQKIIEASNSFGGTIGRLLSLQESYPQLRSNETFQNLMNELSGTENRLNTTRLDYNDAVTKYNTERAAFPGVITASLFGFKEEPYFKAEEGAKTAPKIAPAESLRKTTAPAAPAVNSTTDDNKKN